MDYCRGYGLLLGLGLNPNHKSIYWSNNTVSHVDNNDYLLLNYKPCCKIPINSHLHKGMTSCLRQAQLVLHHGLFGEAPHPGPPFGVEPPTIMNQDEMMSVYVSILVRYICI